MNLVRCNSHGRLAPSYAFGGLEDELNRFFNLASPRTSRWVPSIDLSETADGYTLEADLPGLGEEDIELTVKENVVTLKGERKEASHVEGQGYHRSERRHGSFQRAFELPASIDATQVTAAFDKGVLRVEIPKREEAKPHSIKVQFN